MSRFQKENGGVIWLTGLPGAGKSTIAVALAEKFKAKGFVIELIDGDEVRKIFPNIGFSRPERNQHVERIGHLASVLEKHGVLSLVSLVSPYSESRDFARKLAKNFFEIYLSTSLAICEKRDPKGLYKKARKGEIKQFTGIDDPYDIPANPELTIDTSQINLAETIALIEAKIFS